MKKNIVFLQISKITHVSNFIQHIYQLCQIELSKGDTYNILFIKLIDRFKDKPDELAAVNEWIQYNIEGQEDASVFDTVIAEDGQLFAVFDFQPVLHKEPNVQGSVATDAK